MTTTATDSPVGSLLITERDGQIVRVKWGRLRQQNEHTSLLDEAVKQLKAYFAGTIHGFDLPLAPAGTPFQKDVYRAMLEIPFGETRSYGEIASELASVARAVGQACGSNPIPILIPCHRVLGAGGAIGGFSGGSGVTSKRALLEHEGALTLSLDF